MKHLGLHQCALEAEGGRALAPFCGGGETGALGLEVLDIRENDVEDASGALARAAEASTTLTAFSGLADLRTLKAALTQAASPAEAKEGVPPPAKGVLVAGPHSMCHGALALLLALRPFVVPQPTTATQAASGAPSPIKGADEVKNPLSSSSTATATSSLPGVIIDLRGSAMCGFYQERTEAVDELLSLLAAQHTKPEPREPTPSETPTAAAVDTEEGGNQNEPTVADAVETFAPPQLHIHTLELDDATGLTPNQVKVVFAACAMGEASPAPPTILKLNGEVYKAPSSCSVQ